MHIIDNKALLLKTRKPERITSTIPKSKVIETRGDVSAVLVHWGLEECQVLKNLGFSPPSPIVGRYKWPGMYKPFEHQRTTASFLTINRRAYCLNEQGTGKTVSIAWAADYLMRLGYVRRALIICPLSIMSSAWQGDLFKVLMHRRVDIAHGSRAKREKVIASDAEFVIINFDGVETVLEAIQNAQFDLVVIDEANAVKTPTTKRWKAINSILTPETWLWMATGTPASQSPADAYGLAKMLNPSSVPPYAYSFRDMVMWKVTQFKWVPKKNAQEIVHKTLQPAIRFTKDECLDLPELLYTTRECPLTAQQTQYYKTMKEMFAMEAAGETVTSVNAATNLNKLLQVSCIAEGTEVLTNEGWLPIETITVDHYLWDGVEWVSHQGLVYKGVAQVLELDGVCMTKDHKVLTVSGWCSAKEILDGYASDKFRRAAVRLPNCFTSQRFFDRSNQKSLMAMPMRLRKRSNPGKPISTLKIEAQCATLRVPTKRDQFSTWANKHTAVPHMVQYEATMQQPFRQRLEKLRRTRYNCMSKMADIIREFLGRYATWVRSTLDSRSNRRKWALFSRELSVGLDYRTREQYAIQSEYRNSERNYDAYTSGARVRYKTSNTICPNSSLRLDSRKSVIRTNRNSQKVYDIKNSGPRNRFTVRGATGTPIIVHNCGAVYTDEGKVLEFDITNRYKVLLEAIEESTHKVLVFIPFKHSIDVLHDKLTKDKYSVEVISGDVPAHKRAKIFGDFQNTPNPRILLIQPAAASHGVTLHAANTIVWWAPVTSYETYVQANARIHRQGQKNNCLVVHLVGSAVEQKLYEALQNREAFNETLLDMYKEEIDV